MASAIFVKSMPVGPAPGGAISCGENCVSRICICRNVVSGARLMHGREKYKVVRILQVAAYRHLPRTCAARYRPFAPVEAVYRPRCHICARGLCHAKVVVVVRAREIRRKVHLAAWSYVGQRQGRIGGYVRRRLRGVVFRAGCVGVFVHVGGVGVGVISLIHCRRAGAGVGM